MASIPQHLIGNDMYYSKEILPTILTNRALQKRKEDLTGFALSKTDDGPLVGAAGELIAEHFFNLLLKAGKICSVEYTGDSKGPDFELVLASGRPITVDIKTKRRTVSPKPYFEMSVPAYLYEYEGYSDPDYFLCCQVNSTLQEKEKFTEAWIYGWISKANYFVHRKQVLEGTPVGGPGGRAGKMPTTVYNVEFRHLTPCKDLLIQQIK